RAGGGPRAHAPVMGLLGPTFSRRWPINHRNTGISARVDCVILFHSELMTMEPDKPLSSEPSEPTIKDDDKRIIRFVFPPGKPDAQKIFDAIKVFAAKHCKLKG